jgi:signal transduction histidine kinase
LTSDALPIRAALPALRAALLALVAIGAAFPAHVSAQDHKQVIVLYATRRDSQIALLGDRQLAALIRPRTGSLDFHSEFLDLARFPDPAYQRAFTAFVTSKYEHVRFDLVIAMHDVTYEFAQAHRGDLFNGAPIVFVSTSPGTPRAPNSTGLSIPYDFVDSLRLALHLQPATRHVAVVSGADARDSAFERMARDQFAPFAGQFEFSYLTGLATRDLEKRLASLPPNSIVYYLVVNRDGAGDTYHPLDYLDRVATVANAPTYSWVDSAMDHGIVGGSLKSQAAQIEKVGVLAARILEGEPADAIPVQQPNVQVAQVDWRQLRRWGISESRVPAGTMILHRNPSAWERYRPYIVIAVALLVAQFALIGGLLIQAVRRRRAEAEVRRGRDEIHRSYERIRALGARLLHAQDRERARVARELHDDISQQLALLEIDLEMLTGTATDGAEALAESSLRRSQQIARSVHDLSHQLHPAKLRLLGLVAALKALRRETAARSDVAIALEYDELPPLDPEVTLCLYRVAQEALQNALKYSDARHVVLTLRRAGNTLSLTIADDGRGFDVDPAWGKGLGLVSMAERLESIGGTFAIQSARGQGTRVETTVPLTEAALQADSVSPPGRADSA